MVTMGRYGTSFNVKYINQNPDKLDRKLQFPKRRRIFCETWKNSFCVLKVHDRTPKHPFFCRTPDHGASGGFYYTYGLIIPGIPSVRQSLRNIISINHNHISVTIIAYIHLSSPTILYDLKLCL